MISIETHQKKLRKKHLKSLTKFVVSQNFSHHLNENLSKTRQADVIALYEEELAFLNQSDIFIARDDKHAIVGSIRVLKWDYQSVLPIEKIFSINPFHYAKQDRTQHVYHIGRFAIKKDIRNLNLLKKLLIYAIEPVCAQPTNIAFAECDSKLLRTLTLLGIKTTIIGDSITYLGSETIPVLMTTAGLSDFYFQNRSLIQDEVNLEIPAIQMLQNHLIFNEQMSMCRAW